MAAGAGIGGGGRLPAVELRLPGVRGPSGSRPARPAHPVVGRGERRPPALVPAQRLARRPRPDRGLPRRCTRAATGTRRCRRCCSPTPSSTTRSACCCCGRRRPCGCTPRRRCTRRCATARACCATLERYCPVEWRPVIPGADVSLGDGLSYRAFDVPTTKRARFGTGAEHGRVVGYRLTDERSGGHAVYLPGVQALTPEVRAEIDGCDVPADRRHLLARRRADPARPRRQDVPARWATCPSTARTAAWRSSRRCGVERTIFVHMNNTNPVLLEDSPGAADRRGQRHGGGRGRPRGRGVVRDDDNRLRRDRHRRLRRGVAGPLAALPRPAPVPRPDERRQAQPPPAPGLGGQPLLLPGEHPPQGRGDPRQLPGPRGPPPLDPPDRRPRRHRGRARAASRRGCASARPSG